MKASDRYTIVVQPPPRWIVPGLFLIAFVVSLLGQSEPWTYGRRSACISDRSSGKPVGRFVEPLIVNRNSRFGLMLTAADTVPPDEFEQVWLCSDDNTFTTQD